MGALLQERALKALSDRDSGANGYKNMERSASIALKGVTAYTNTIEGGPADGNEPLTSSRCQRRFNAYRLVRLVSQAVGDLPDEER
jgi:hypothetical protein